MRKIKLPPGTFCGRPLQSRQVAGLLFSEHAFAPNSHVPTHTHLSAYFYIVLDGACTETCGRTERAATPSTLLFTPAGEPHSDTWCPVGGRVFNFELPPEWLADVRQHGQIVDRLCDFREDPLIRLATRLYREFKTPDSMALLAMQGLALEIVAEASRIAPARAERRPARWLRDALSLLHERFTEELTLDALSREVNVHPTHLARAFRRQYHCTVGEYLRGLRMAEACRALRATDTSIADIALSAGYSDQSHFTNAFKRQTGFTPAAYRKAHRTP